MTEPRSKHKSKRTQEPYFSDLFLQTLPWPRSWTQGSRLPRSFYLAESPQSEIGPKTPMFRAHYNHYLSFHSFWNASLKCSVRQCPAGKPSLRIYGMFNCVNAMEKNKAGKGDGVCMEGKARGNFKYREHDNWGTISFSETKIPSTQNIMCKSFSPFRLRYFIYRAGIL